MFSPLHDSRSYVCPGEPGAVSRSIHLARLAASYGRCQECPHRQETGVLGARREKSSEKIEHGSCQSTRLLQTAHGFRGIYLNQLDRHAAITWAAALAAVLWEETSVATLRRTVTETSLEESLEEPLPEPPQRRLGPTIVIGYDERPSSPDILTGVALGLERMSCQVIDIGLRTEPCLSFAVHHLSADAGIYVTGAGSEPAWTGFDVRRKHGLPADSQFLQRWTAASRAPISRPSRSASTLRAFPAAVPYETNLWKHFHALRPLQVVCGTPSPMLIARLERLFARLPGRLIPVALPIRRRKLDDPHDADTFRVAETVREHSAHFGMVIDDDGAACSFIDERGQPTPQIAINTLALDHILRDNPGGLVVISRELEKRLAPKIAARGGKVQLVAEAERAACLMASAGLLAAGSDHRLWFGGDAPACDAIVTLAVIMQALSRSDADCSRVIAGLR